MSCLLVKALYRNEKDARCITPLALIRMEDDIRTEKVEEILDQEIRNVDARGSDEGEAVLDAFEDACRADGWLVIDDFSRAQDAELVVNHGFTLDITTAIETWNDRH